MSDCFGHERICDWSEAMECVYSRLTCHVHLHIGSTAVVELLGIRGLNHEVPPLLLLMDLVECCDVAFRHLYEGQGRMPKVTDGLKGNGCPDIMALQFQDGIGQLVQEEQRQRDVDDERHDLFSVGHGRRADTSGR